MKKALIGLAIAAGVIVLTCGGGLIWLWAASGTPAGVGVTVDQPDAITVGDTFDMTVTIADSLARERKVYDIDFWSPLLDGVSVLSVSPAEERYDGMFGIETYTMNQPVPAGGELVITFNLRADTPGVYRGDLDIGVDGMLKIITTPHTIRIDP